MNTKDVEAVKTASGRVLKLRVRNVGQSYGCVGQVVAGNGRVIAETEPCPLGFTEAALNKARALAEVL